MLKILQARLQQYVNCELPDVQVGFRKGKKPEIKLPTSVGSSKKQESSRKTSTSALLITPKPLAVWITTNCGKFFKRWEYQTTLCASWETCMQVKKQQSEPYMEQWTGSKLGKEYIKAISSSACLTYMQSTSGEMPCWMKHKLESRFQEKYRPPQICRWYHLKGRKWRGTKEPVNEGGRGVKKLA